MSNSIIGTGWNFPILFNSSTSGPITVNDEELINQAIYILLNTQLSERNLIPDFGSKLANHLFAIEDDFMLSMLKDSIENALINHEPRIILEDVSFDTQYILDGQLNVILNYKIKVTNARSNIVFPFYLAEKSI